MNEYKIGQTFEAAYPPEAAAWCNSNNAYITEIAPQNGVRRFQIVAVPEPTFEDERAAKLSELSSKFAAAEAEAHLTSSLGFEINAGEKANRDIDGLIKLMEAMPNMETVEFCCFDNSYHTVTLADLKTMQIEVILSGNALYQQKWAFRDAINAATTKEKLEAIKIEFVFSNFAVA